jgi:hypothetical protein
VGGGHLSAANHVYRDQSNGAGVLLADSPNWTGSHVWDQEDAGTTTVPTPVTLQHRNNAAGTPAAGYGVGEVFKLDSSARNLRSAAELDVIWTTATDAAEVAAIVAKAMVAGTLTEVARVNAVAGTGPDVDSAFMIGRALIDARSTDTLNVSHRDMTATTQYALQQNAIGATRLNSAGGQTCRILVGNSTRFTADATGIGFYAAAGVAQQTITGSKGANAALASLMTALAALGLVVDSTT